MSETSTTVTHPDGTTITVTTAGENTAEPKPGQTGTDLLADVSIAGQAQIDIYDPHFHIWDINEGSKGGYADPTTLFVPPKQDGTGIYNQADLEADWATLPAPFVYTGGVFLEALSCCFADKPNVELNVGVLKEAEWVAAELSKSKHSYKLAVAACLEDPDALTVLKKLAANPDVKGIRQALNMTPDWPRNGKNAMKHLGCFELMDDPQWEIGYAGLAEVDFSFDMQLNPHQYLKGAKFAAKYPKVPVIINHLGTPTLDDLKDGGAVYWAGMKALAAAGDHVYIKISMLCYLDVAWDQNELVVDAVTRIIALFGEDRCFFASNYPVDFGLPDVFGSWVPEKLYPTFLRLARKAGVSDAGVLKLFAGNARKAYRA